MDQLARFIQMATKINIKSTGLTVFGAIHVDNPRNSEFEIELPSMSEDFLPFAKYLRPGPLKIRVTCKPEFGGEFEIIANFDGSPLRFQARVMMSPVQVIVSGQEQSIACSWSS